MSYSLKIEQFPDYLQVIVTGKGGGFEIGIQYLEELGEICSQKNCKKVLIIDHLIGKITVNEIISVIARLKEVGFHDVKIAFVDTKISQMMEDTFKEALVAMTRLNGNIFSHVEEAKNWLLKP